MKNLTKISYKLWMALITVLISMAGMLIFILNFKIESTFDVKITPNNQKGTIMVTEGSNVSRLRKDQEIIIKANKKTFKVLIDKVEINKEKKGLYNLYIKIPKGGKRLPLVPNVTLDATVIYNKTTVSNLIWDI